MNLHSNTVKSKTFQDDTDGFHMFIKGKETG